MSLHARCPQRIAGISAHRTLRRWRGARCYASYTTEEPEWFREKRGILLARKPHHHHEVLDVTHSSGLRAALEGFEPSFNYGSLAPIRRQRVHLSNLLTRFNIRVGTSQLFTDGTDPLHSPGKLWPRRMWAGGAVRVNPQLDLESETPFHLMQLASCVERIKDVRLLGGDDEAKIIVTVERSYKPHGKSRDAIKVRTEDKMETKTAPEENTSDDWSNAWVKEERNLVFLKAKTAAELTSIHAGELLVPRYLKAPDKPDFTHSLTPTRTLLFRYSAITYNAHLLHLDPTYARNIEGHRNLLVHGPLTLTLMLQSVKKHFQTLKPEDSNQKVESIEYRNVAPLYCDEEMRICVKEKRRTDTGSVWDVWIEGPTGGMAVKALVRSVRMPLQQKVAPPMKAREALAVRGCPLSYLYTQGSPLMARIQSQQLSEPESTATDERPEPRPTATEELPKPPTTPTKHPHQNPRIRKYSRRWLDCQVGYGLRYLYFNYASPLFNTNVVARSSSSEQDIKTSSTPVPSPPRGQTSSSSDAPAKGLTLAQRQRAVLLAQSQSPAHPSTASAPAPSGSPQAPQPPPTIRKVEHTVVPKDLFKMRRNKADARGNQHGSVNSEAEAGASVVEHGKQRTRRGLKIRKMQQTVIRKTDTSLKETAVRRYHAHRKMVLPPAREK